jgi:hypothetical protein
LLFEVLGLLWKKKENNGSKLSELRDRIASLPVAMCSS